MGRRKKKRFVQSPPKAAFFKPQGIPLRDLECQELSMEGFEAVRLVDCEKMQHQDAADLMGVSRPTLSRVLSEARTAIATALTHGRAIQIEGGDYHIPSDEDAPSTQYGEEAMNNKQGNQSGRCGRGQGMGQGCGRGGRGGQNRRTQQPQSTPTTQQSTDAMTKIAISSEGPTLADRVDPRFGRAGGFVIVNTATMQTEYVDNGASQAMAQGAGIQAAETIANSGAQVLLTGYVGPKAFTALNAVGIAIGQDVDGMTVQEAVEKFKRGEVTLADSANAQAGGNK